MRSYYHNPYYSCYPQQKFGYFHFYKKAQDVHIEEEILRYWELIQKAYAYAYGQSIAQTQKKIQTYLKIGELACADELADQINDIFYWMQYIANVIWEKALYGHPTCRSSEFIKCFKKYWYCKRIDITPVLKEFEWIDCSEEGVDYMVIIDPLVNSSATPPNQVR